MGSQVWKWTSMIGAGAAAMIVYRELKTRATLLQQAITDGERLDRSLDDSFPASDPVAQSPTLGAKIAR